MEIFQETDGFEPITIVLEPRSEANAMVTIVDDVGRQKWVMPTSPQKKLSAKISDAFSNQKVKI